MFGHLLLIISVAICDSTPRNFFHPAMCEIKGSVDCSFQMPDEKNAFCMVYNTSECRNFDFSGWMKQPPKHPTNQSDSTYSVDVSSYACNYGKGGSLFDEALNITFTTSDKDINGYVLLLENSVIPLNICRIFDFRNTSTKDYVMLFYDCLVSLTSSYIVQNFEMKVKALPQNEEMMYSLFLPTAHNIETENVCEWNPLVMVFKGGLQKNIVEIKFSQAPVDLNVSSYEVSLLPKQSDESVQTVTVKATQAAFINVMFSHVDQGIYSVHVRPLSGTSSKDCEIVRYTTFSIENKLFDKIIIFYIIVVCLVGFAIAITIQLFLGWLFKPGPTKSSPVVLLIYSYDCKEHNDVVIRYIRYLENQCHMKVLTIYGEQRPELDLWLRSPYNNCDVIMIIISEGVLYEGENCSSPAVKEGYSCRGRLSRTLNFLKTKMFSDNKKLIPVYFEYSGAYHIPSFMQSGQWGKAFVIPREVNYMLCKAYNQNPKIACLGVYPRMPGHDVVSSPEGMALIESIEEMKKVLKENNDVELMKLNECATKKPESSCEGYASHTDNKDKLKPKYFSTDEKKYYIDDSFGLNVPSKQQHSHAQEHVCDEENCAHLNLLQGSELCADEKHESRCAFNEQNSLINNISNVLDNTEEINTTRQAQDLEYILSTPGPSFSFLDTSKILK